MEDEVSLVLSTTIETGESFTTKSHFCTRLSSCRYVEWLLPDNRYLYHLGNSESGFSRRDRYSIVELSPLTSQSAFTSWHLECDIEVTITISTTMSLVTHLDTHTILYTCWYFDGFLDLFTELSLPMTVSTLLDYLLTCTMTRATWLCLFHHTEYRLYAFTYLSTSMTGSTCLSCSSLTIAVVAVNISVKCNLASCASDSILERYLESHLDIFTDICLASSSSPSTTKSPSKELRKYIPNISSVESSLKSSTTKSPHTFGRTKSVIVGFFCWV